LPVSGSFIQPFVPVVASVVTQSNITPSSMPSHMAASRTSPPNARRRGRTVVPRGERERQMLEAAGRLFAERGFDGVSMDEIADAVGITKPMLYAYFDSKEGLFTACMERAARPLLDSVRAAIDPSGPPEIQLWRALLAFFHFVDDHRDEWSVFYVEAAGRGGGAAKRLRAVRDEVSAVMGELLRATAIAAGIAPELETELEVLAEALNGSSEALARWWIEHPDKADADLLALRLMNFAWMGFGDLLSGRLWLPPPELAPSSPQSARLSAG
jgi:AcrR family transcriptional regulator